MLQVGAETVPKSLDPKSTPPVQDPEKTTAGRDKDIPADPDISDGEKIRKAVEEADKANWEIPKTNTNWKPMQPEPGDDFSDPDFMDRVKLKQNTLEKLREIEEIRQTPCKGLPGYKEKRALRCGHL